MRLYILTLWRHKITRKEEQENVPKSAKLSEPSAKSIFCKSIPWVSKKKRTRLEVPTKLANLRLEVERKAGHLTRKLLV